MKLLILGGSGFLSGTLARLALEQGHEVWAFTRGQRPLPGGVRALVTDRHDVANFKQAVRGAGTAWDIVADCIAFQPDDIRQDLSVFPGLAGQLVYISTDFVYDPEKRRFPQDETNADYLPDGYGGKKRQGEQVLLDAGTDRLPWTVLRPGHIYGPGSQLGCLPAHGRDPQLLRRMKDGETLRLVGGGRFLQQPIFARDLAKTILSLAGNTAANGQIYNAAGPDVIESRVYYEIIADLLGISLQIEEIPVSTWAAEHPEHASFLCHRFYDLTRLRDSGAAVPSTSIAEGLREHVAAMEQADQA